MQSKNWDSRLRLTRIRYQSASLLHCLELSRNWNSFKISQVDVSCLPLHCLSVYYNLIIGSLLSLLELLKFFCLFCLLLFEYEHSLIDLPPPWPLFMGPAIVNSILRSPFVFGKDPTSYNSIAALCKLGKVYFVRLKIAIIDCRQTKCCFTLPPVILASN